MLPHNRKKIINKFINSGKFIYYGQIIECIFALK